MTVNVSSHQNAKGNNSLDVTEHVRFQLGLKEWWFPRGQQTGRKAGMNLTNERVSQWEGGHIFGILSNHSQ